MKCVELFQTLIQNIINAAASLLKILLRYMPRSHEAPSNAPILICYIKTKVKCKNVRLMPTLGQTHKIHQHNTVKPVLSQFMHRSLFNLFKSHQNCYICKIVHNLMDHKHKFIKIEILLLMIDLFTICRSTKTNCRLSIMHIDWVSHFPCYKNNSQHPYIYIIFFMFQLEYFISSFTFTIEGKAIDR